MHSMSEKHRLVPFPSHHAQSPLDTVITSPPFGQRWGWLRADSQYAVTAGGTASEGFEHNRSILDFCFDKKRK